MNTLRLIVDTLRYWWWRLTGRLTVHDLIQAEYDALEPYVTDGPQPSPEDAGLFLFPTQPT